MPNVTVRDVKLHYELRGAGPALLCLPGALGTGKTDFGPQLTEWSKSYTVVAPDPRGYGRSRPPERDFSEDFFQRDADDMAELMTSLGYDRYLLAGWSDGANSAVLLAADHPCRVKKLVIWGGNSFISADDIAKMERLRQISVWSDRVRQNLVAVYGDSLQDLWSRYCDGIQAIFRSQGRICNDKLALIRCPTLILHGAKDPITPEFHPCMIHQGIAGSQLHVFESGRHDVHLALFEEFNRVVLPFLAKES